MGSTIVNVTFNIVTNIIHTFTHLAKKVYVYIYIHGDRNGLYVLIYSLIHKPNLYSILKLDCLYIRNYTFVSICLSLDVNSRSPSNGELSTVRFPI